MVQRSAKQGPVEAKSLSTITTLASNPPKYPRNPTQQPLEKLVLYIVRVPGSRDVFLTPLKPATKSSISAEAINTSLYYLHVSTEEDENIRQTIEQERLAKKQYAEENPKSQGQGGEELAHLNNVRRKPVPGAGAAAGQQEDIPAPPLPLRPSLQPGWSMNSELSYGDGTGQLPVPYGLQSTNNNVPAGVGNGFSEPRKPVLPRRPLPPLPNDGGSGLSPGGQASRDPSPRRWSAQPGPAVVPGANSWREDPEAPEGRFSLDSRRPVPKPNEPNNAQQGNRAPTQCLQRPSQPPVSRSFDGPRDTGTSRFHVTLIRRDPGHGSQWNVGTISNHESAAAGDDSSIDLEISTPGYKQFARNDEPLSLADLGISLPSAGQSGSNSSLSILQLSAEQAARKSPVSGPLSFTRKVCLLPPQRNHRRFSSSNDSNDPTTRDQSPAKSPVSKSRGVYTFTSPWNGTCAFSMGVNGRSLRCKHTIAEPSSNFTTGTPSSSPTVTAAEIRFNLPTFTSSTTTTHQGRKPRPQYQQYQQPQQPSFSSPHYPQENNRPGSSSADPTEKRRPFSTFFNPSSQDRSQSHSPSRVRGGHFHTRQETNNFNHNHNNHSRTNNNSSSDPFTSASPDPDRLDLGLARERAGGGLRGKSAKLGKLIIDDEGLKMLDLVVAACMGVWWKYYD